MTPAQRDNLLEAHSAAMARIRELEAERDRLRTFLVDDAATEGQWAKLKRENALLLKALATLKTPVL